MMRPGSWLIHTCCRTRSISSFVILSSSSLGDSSLLVDSPELIPSEHFKPWSLSIRSRSLLHAQRQATYLPCCCGVLPPVCLASLRVGWYSFRWALVVDVLPSWAAASSDQTFGVALSDCQCCAQAHTRIYSRTRTHARLERFCSAGNFEGVGRRHHWPTDGLVRTGFHAGRLDLLGAFSVVPSGSCTKEFAFFWFSAANIACGAPEGVSWGLSTTAAHARAPRPRGFTPARAYDLDAASLRYATGIGTVLYRGPRHPGPLDLLPQHARLSLGTVPGTENQNTAKESGGRLWNKGAGLGCPAQCTLKDQRADTTSRRSR